MTSNWAMQQIPTSALIDPDGNLVRDGRLEILEKQLDRDSRTAPDS